MKTVKIIFMRRLFYSLLLITMQHSFSQAGSISGYVVNQSKTPVAFLQAILLPNHIGTITDSSGHFNIEKIPTGIYDLKLIHIGYRTKIFKNITIKNDTRINLGNVILHQNVISLNDVIITATRTERNYYELPQPINNVADITIRERHAKTTAEALREEAGIYVQKTNHGGGSAIIRGLSSNQILILVDGIRLNNSTYRLGNHQYLTTVDNNAINRIEVVRGPMSVLYGSDALGGTINLITNQQNPGNSDLGFSYNLFGRYASADNERTLRITSGLRNQKIAFYSGLSLKKYDDLQRGNYNIVEKTSHELIQAPSGYSGYDFDSKLIYNLSPKQTMKFAYQLSRKENVPRYDKYEHDDYFRWLYNPQKRDLAYIIYETNLSKKYISSIRVSLSINRQAEGREIQKSSTTQLTIESAEVYTTGLNFQMNSNFQHHKITYGGELYTDKINSERFLVDPMQNSTSKDIRGRYPDDAIYNSTGLYLQDEIIYSKSFKSIIGIRYNHLYTDFSIPGDSTDSEILSNIHQTFKSVTGQVGLLYRYNDHTYFNINIGQGFRAPNISDMSKLGESKGNTYEIPNSNLEPEKLVSFDIGMKLNFTKLQGSISIYHTRITDILTSVESTYYGSPVLLKSGVTYKIKTKKNIGKAFIRGLETDIHYYLTHNLSIHNNLTITYGHNSTFNEPIGGIPPVFGYTSMKFNKNVFGVDFYVRYSAKQTRLSKDDIDDPRIPESGTPAWYTINLRTSLMINKWGKIQAAVENLIDYNYREHGSGINGPGRNFIVSFEINNFQ